MAWTIVASDSFNRADDITGLEGGALDNALGGSGSFTWVESAGTGNWGVYQNKLNRQSGGANGILRVAGLTIGNDQKVQALITNTGFLDWGLVARWTASGTLGTFYMTFVANGGQVIVYRCDGTDLTNMGQTSVGAVDVDDTVAIQCVGDQVSALVNDAVVLGPYTNALYASGVPAVYGSTANLWFDDVIVYESADTVPALTVEMEEPQGDLTSFGNLS